MSMSTQCPSCSTTFRVTPQQLQSQHGMVRCGRCALVFDGFKALATLPEEVAAAALPRTVVPAPVVVDTTPGAAPPVAAPQPIVTEPVTPAHETAAPAAVAFDDDAAFAASYEQSPIVEPPPVETTAAPAFIDTTPHPEPVPIAVPVAMPVAEFVEPSTATFAPPVARRRGPLWALASVMLLMLLGAQFVFLYRGDIAATLPEARPLLNEWCKALNCTVALPQRPRQISIEASDMQAADTTNPGLVILTATLRNQAASTLGYPALDVVLTNTREHTVARRIFMPNEYLTDGRQWRAGIAPAAEVTIRLNIDSGDLGAAGFRLDLMAAPSS